MDSSRESRSASIWSFEILTPSGYSPSSRAARSLRPVVGGQRGRGAQRERGEARERRGAAADRERGEITTRAADGARPGGQRCRGAARGRARIRGRGL